MQRAPVRPSHAHAQGGETMTDDYIPQPRPQLSDEAAALLLDFLYDLITDFESAYASQIRRHHQAEAADHAVNQQLPLVRRPRRRSILKSGKPAA